MILITGASGNVGKEVLKQITQTGVEVRAAFQSVSKAAGAPSGVEIVAVDYNQPETLRTALKAVERIFLVGPPTAQYLPGTTPNQKITSKQPAFPIRFFGRTDLCRTWLTTMLQQLTLKARFMEAKAMVESAR